MAVYWNLGLLARSREEADACSGFFLEKKLTFEGIEIALELSRTESIDGWLIGIWPRGMNYGSPMGSEPRLTTDAARREIAECFDRWLSEAPPFMAAFFGCEAYDFWLDNPLAELDGKGSSGLMVDHSLWNSLGQPIAARKLSADRFAWPRTRDP